MDCTKKKRKGIVCIFQTILNLHNSPTYPSSFLLHLCTLYFPLPFSNCFMTVLKYLRFSSCLYILMHNMVTPQFLCRQIFRKTVKILTYRGRKKNSNTHITLLHLVHSFSPLTNVGNILLKNILIKMKFLVTPLPPDTIVSNPSEGGSNTAGHILEVS